jgi:hypothetical protein
MRLRPFFLADRGGFYPERRNPALLEVVFDGDAAVGGADEHGALFALARAEEDLAASGFDEHLAGGDVPEADLLFDVGVEAAAGDVGHGEGGAAEHAGLADVVGDFLVTQEAGFDGLLGFGEPDGDDGVGHLGAGADLDGFAIERGGQAFGDLPEFIHHGVVDDTDEELVGVFATGGDGDAEVGDAEEVVHGAVDGIDDPFDVAIAADVGIAFLAEDEVVGVAVENELHDEFLAANVHFEFDVMALHFIDGEVRAEVFFDELAGAAGGFGGGFEEFVHKWGFRDWGFGKGRWRGW